MGKYAGYDFLRDIVMVSTADWDEPLWTNKQQIASRLASDFRVLYVEPLSSLANGHHGYTHRYWRDDTGVHILRPPGTVPFGRKIAQVNEMNHRLVAPIIRERIEQIGFKDFVLWIYPPWDAPYLDQLKPALSCYDCVDEYSAMPGAWIQSTRRMERKLIEKVDVVFTTAKSLYEDKKRFNPNAFFVPNVADFDLFHKTLTVKPSREIDELPHPIIGFVGALNYKLNVELMDKLFSMRPDWSFVFVGPDRGIGIERFSAHRNAKFLGKKPIEELPSYMAAMDVCIIPYRIDRYTRGVLPLKFFEYLASGRPVVSSRLPELEPYEKLADLCGGAVEFVNAIERRLEEDTKQNMQKRIELARENSWDKRIHTILKKLEEVWKAKRESK